MEIPDNRGWIAMVSLATVLISLFFLEINKLNSQSYLVEELDVRGIVTETWIAKGEIRHYPNGIYFFTKEDKRVELYGNIRVTQQ